jgi:hypothetical protein
VLWFGIRNGPFSMRFWRFGIGVIVGFGLGLLVAIALGRRYEVNFDKYETYDYVIRFDHWTGRAAYIPADSDK